MLKKYFLFVILVSLFSFSQKKGQSAIDSLKIILPKIKIDTVKVEILCLISKNFKNVDALQGIEFASKALTLSKKIKWFDGISISLINIGINKQHIGEIVQAEKNFQEAILFAKNKQNLIKANFGLGNLEFHKTNLPKALEFYFSALKLSESLKDEKLIENCFYYIGDTYKSMKNYKKALIYLNKSLILNKKLKNDYQIASTLTIIGEVYYYMSNIDKAILNLESAKKINEKINSNNGLLNTTFLLSKVYTKQGNLIQSLNNIKFSEKIAEKTNNTNLIAGCKLSEAATYIEMFTSKKPEYDDYIDLKKSEKLINEVIVYCKETKNTINLANCYQTQSELFTVLNKHKEAKIAIVNYAEIKDSIYSEKSKETVKNLEDQRTINLKNKEILINKITLESKEKQKWIYIFGIGFLAILGGLMFYQSQSRKKINLKLETLNQNLDQANKTKIKFLSILNHDLRSPVYNFIHFMQLQKESPELLDDKTKQEIEEKTILSAENLLISMEDILLWSKGQMDNFEPQPKLILLNDIFEYAQNHFKSETKIQLIFENSNNISIFTDENFLKTIIRNFTGNAIKALINTENPIIVWKAWQEQSIIFLSITDNGTGANEEKFKALYDENEVIGIQSGLGLHLIRDIAKAINCDISVDSNIGLGTTFLIKFGN